MAAEMWWGARANMTAACERLQCRGLLWLPRRANCGVVRPLQWQAGGSRTC